MLRVVTNYFEGSPSWRTFVKRSKIYDCRRSLNFRSDKRCAFCKYHHTPHWRALTTLSNSTIPSNYLHLSHELPLTIHLPSFSSCPRITCLLCFRFGNSAGSKARKPVKLCGPHASPRSQCSKFISKVRFTQIFVFPNKSK